MAQIGSLIPLVLVKMPSVIAPPPSKRLILSQVLTIELVCDTTDGGTVCDGLTPLLALNKSVQITDRIVVTESNSLVTSVSNSWSQKTNVPGPLPLMGAGVAFGYSRKLRRRITTAKAV